MPEPGNIAAIVLAAGASRRFGSDKLLHQVVREGVALPLAAHSLLPWLEAFGQITVVIRPAAEAFCREIEAALGNARSAEIRWEICREAAQGMSASLVSGINANRSAAGWLIGLADMPAVPAMAIAGVRDALLGGARLAAPFCGGRRGHPVGFAAHYRDELLLLQGDAGARHVLKRDSADVAEVRIDDKGILADVDVSGDLLRISDGKD